jgi:hypothetical protein
MLTNKELKWLMKACDANNYKLSTPWPIDGATVATDGHRIHVVYNSQASPDWTAPERVDAVRHYVPPLVEVYDLSEVIETPQIRYEHNGNPMKDGAVKLVGEGISVYVNARYLKDGKFGKVRSIRYDKKKQCVYVLSVHVAACIMKLVDEKTNS